METRKKNRLKYWNYSRVGMYFITICTEGKKKILSKIGGDGFPVPQMTKYGECVEEYIEKINEKYPTVIVNKYVVMPNHIHMILFINDKNGTGNPSPTVSNVIGWLKYNITKSINQNNRNAGQKLFQRSFHDHIIRNEADYKNIWAYIDNNPLKWELDCFYY